MVAGRPLAEVSDPFVLEVHRPVQPEGTPTGLPVLPPYVPREHDQVLGQVMRAAAGGRSGIAVLVGGSSTGKTRACWEAVALLRDQDPPWRLWHPIDPTRPDAALRGAAGHRAADRGMAERGPVLPRPGRGRAGRTDRRRAAGTAARPRPGPGAGAGHRLARILGRPDRPPAGGDDRHAQARELLAGHDITVPAAFTPAQMGQLARAADMRMALAAWAFAALFIAGFNQRRNARHNPHGRGGIKHLARRNLRVSCR